MDRLTKRKYGEIVSSKREKKEIHCSNFCNNCSQGSGNCEYVKDMIEKLAEYEDLEEKELLLKLPCKVGDIIYEIVNDEIISFSFQQQWRIARYLEAGIFGKIAFLTKEEAEQALKRLEGAK
jgi:hypothetical protein